MHSARFRICACEGYTLADTSGLICRKHNAQGFDTISPAAEDLASSGDRIYKGKPFISPRYVTATDFRGLVCKGPVEHGFFPVISFSVPYPPPRPSTAR